MNTQKKKVLFTLITILSFCVVLSSNVMAQGDSSGFTEDFETINWEQWEHSQDVMVESGVLRINSGNFVFSQVFFDFIQNYHGCVGADKVLRAHLNGAGAGYHELQNVSS